MIINRLIYVVFVFGFIASCSKQGGNAASDKLKQMESKQNEIRSMKDIHSNYESSEKDWINFLECWGNELVKHAHESQIHAGIAPLLQKNKGHITNVGTSKYAARLVELDQLEQKLSTPHLPPSFRHFALVSGGYWVASLNIDSPSLESNLTPIGKIGFFKDVDSLNWGVWNEAMKEAGVRSKDVPASEYYRYGNDQDLFRWAYLEKLVKVGELEQGTILLINPLEITADGEWEAWILSTQVGAIRYRSFAELMQTIAYQELSGIGGFHVAQENLLSSCSKYLRTAATLKH